LINWLKLVRSWLGRWISWAWQFRRLLIAAFGIVGVPLFWGQSCWVPLFSGWEPRIRWAGMSLELMGLITVMLGIRDTRLRFGRPSLLTIGRELLRDFPRFRKDERMSFGTGNITLEGVTMSAVGTTSLPPNASLEERVTFLEGKTNQTYLLINEQDNFFREEIKRLKHEDKDLGQKISGGDNENKRLLEDVAAGGLNLEILGVSWLFFGIILATASNEIVKLCSLIKLYFLN
jgi:hypothetical protein